MVLVAVETVALAEAVVVLTWLIENDAVTVVPNVVAVVVATLVVNRLRPEERS